MQQRSGAHSHDKSHLNVASLHQHARAQATQGVRAGVVTLSGAPDEEQFLVAPDRQRAEADH